MLEQLEICPSCKSPYGYFNGLELYICPECSFEWSLESEVEEKEEDFVVKDSNGNTLKNGDSVIVIKSLKFKGSNTPLKSGTKVKNIRLVDSNHNIDCKIDGFGAMALKSEFVKKA